MGSARLWRLGRAQALVEAQQHAVVGVHAAADLGQPELRGALAGGLEHGAAEAPAP